MTRTVIEQLARAICSINGDDPDGVAYPPQQFRYAQGRQYIMIPPTEEFLQPAPMWHFYVKDARAALEALKKCSPVLGDMRKRKGSLDTMYREDLAAWGEVIDMMLNEGER